MMLKPIGFMRRAAAGAVFDMTAGAVEDLTGYISAQYATDISAPTIAIGSVSGNINADGGTVEIVGTEVGSNLLFVWILNGNQSASNISIDGTNYALSFTSIATRNGNDYDTYEVDPFGGSDFVDTVTYAIEVT